jgi:phosphohistidine phosphatase
MRLYFLRHGIAQDHAPGLSDSQRALVPEGIRKIEHLAGRLSAMEVTPMAVYSSPLVRAYQTAAIIAEHVGASMEVIEELAPGFNNRLLQPIVDKHAQTDDLMLVGHEPDFSTTISYLIGGGNVLMKKGGLARVDLHSQHPLYGVLVWLVSPKLV